MTTFVLKLALFAIGAGAFGTGTYYVFENIPQIENIGNLNRIGNHTPIYWIGIFVLSLLGGIFVRCYEKTVLIVGTSVLGGILLSYAVNGIFAAANYDPNRWILFSVAAIASVTGVVCQKRIEKYGFPACCRRHNPQSRLDVQP